MNGALALTLDLATILLRLGPLVFALQRLAALLETPAEARRAIVTRRALLAQLGDRLDVASVRLGQALNTKLVRGAAVRCLDGDDALGLVIARFRGLGFLGLWLATDRSSVGTSRGGPPPINMGLACSASECSRAARLKWGQDERTEDEVEKEMSLQRIGMLTRCSIEAR